MTTNINNKAGEVVGWHGWCETKGFPHDDQDTHDFIARKWGDLDLEIRTAIYERSKVLMAERAAAQTAPE